MIICNVCNIEKEDNQFQKYWHSSQNKFRIRKQCTSCFYAKRKKVPVEEKPIEPDYSNDPLYRFCVTCNTYQLKTNYYNYQKKYCKNCYKKMRVDQDVIDRQKEILETCGGLDYFNEPNQYKNDIQKGCLFSLMEAMGWSFNESNGIWHKPNFKGPNGEWYKPIKTQVQKMEINLNNMIELRKCGYSYKQIANKLGCSHNKVYYNLKSHGYE